MGTTSNGSPSGNDGATAAIAALGYGGLQATILSAVALVISGFSLYESSFKTAELEVFVPPLIHYARDGDGAVEVFAVPVTITNAGARTGTVLSMQLEVEELASHRKKRFYSALLGEHQADATATNRSFAPLSIAGHATFTDTVRFYPAADQPPRLAEDAGDFRFTLQLITAVPAHPDLIDRYLQVKPEPVVFERTLPWVSDEQLGQRRITIAMRQRNTNDTPSPQK